MGFLLKEALKTLCRRNQWSYAVFWKIGCQNSKLLIWEECYYEPLPCPFPTHIAGIGTSNFSFEDGGPSQLRNQEGEGICSLVNKMMVNSSVNIAGEGIIGRAAFTGNHEWILLNNFTRDAYPPEVYNELHHQFSAGMQTVAVIPVLPHGVVQMGSFLAKMENIGLINEVKSLILQLGCIPGALLSEDYSAKASTETLGGPGSVGVPVSVNPPIFTSKCTPFMANGSDQQSNSSLGSSSFVQPSHPHMGEINNHQSSLLLTNQSTNLTQPSSKYIDNFYQSKATAMMKPSFGGRLENRVMEAEVVPSNLNSGLQPHSVLYNARSAFNELTGFGQSDRSDYSRTFMEQQILSCIGNPDHVIPTTNASSALKMTQLKTNGSHIPDQSRGSVSTSLLRGVPTHGGMNGNLRPNLVSSSVSNPQRVATADFSGTHTAEIELRYNNLTEAGVYSLPDQASQSGVSPMTLEGLDQMNLPADLKRAHDVLAPADQRTDDDLLHALKIPSLQLEDHVPLSGHIPGIVNDCLNSAVVNHSSRKIDAKPEELCAQPSSGEDLFDVLGVDFKNKLLNENWDTFFADELNANAENLDKAACVDVQGIDPDCCSINETFSDSGVFSGRCTDHLLDAVVSKAQSVVKQDSDDVSCRTTLTRISNTSVPSPSFRQPMSDHVPGRLFDCPKTLGKNGAAEASSLRSGCSKDDAGNCSQTTSIYGSQLSSWVENASNIKRESSISTGYSKRPDEVAKSTNRKRLKPGENPRPRPKDRQMIQDRVKELRDIVPNGAKCSIDALLERTIKHMLFLQSVTKHADKLKQTGESKIISKEGGLLLKDNFEGGATWAYEVGSQSMVCPIIVEDLNPPRQMLVEMLCEERGFFLEIADLIRGMGLTILKGVMEARNDKIWARFAVEANRDVTRMEIFMSLVHLLEQTGKGGASSSNPIDNNMMAYHAFPQAAQIPATGMPSSL